MASSVPTHAPQHVGSTLPGAGGPAQGAPPARQLGPYLLERELGRGSYGAVFLARHGPSGSQVALKVLLGAQDAESVSRFRREAAITARLQSPAIVRTLDVGFDGKHPYYAMDYCPGPTLKDALRSQGSLPPAEAAALVKKLAEAAAEAHQWGVIHRDLKPANVILTEPGGEPKITDFGLARDYAQDRLTHTGELLGTPAYMAPEQFRGERGLDHRVDLYALGVILYQLLTGQIPYRAPTIPELGQLVEAGQAVPPRSLAPAVPAELEAVCLKAMAPDPNRRFVTASALAAALAPHCPAAPGGAGPARSTRAPRAARSAPPALAWAGWGLAAVCLPLLGWSLLRAPAAPGVVADAPAADAGRADAPASVLADAEEELRLLRAEPVPTETLVRQLRRVRALSTDPARREALAAEAKGLELASELLRDLKQANDDRVRPEFEAEREAKLSELLEGLPPTLRAEADAELKRLAARAELARAFEGFDAAASRGADAAYEGALGLLERFSTWLESGVVVEALEGLMQRLESLQRQHATARFPLLRAAVLLVLSRPEEAATPLNEAKQHSDLGPALHDLRESGLFPWDVMRALHRALGFGRGRHH